MASRHKSSAARRLPPGLRRLQRPVRRPLHHSRPNGSLRAEASSSALTSLSSCRRTSRTVAFPSCAARSAPSIAQPLPPRSSRRPPGARRRPRGQRARAAQLPLPNCQARLVFHCLSSGGPPLGRKVAALMFTREHTLRLARPAFRRSREALFCSQDPEAVPPARLLYV